MVKNSPIVDAYSTLGLENGSSPDLVKSAYKQLALRTHPDKNPGNVEATAQFQKLSAAYSVLLKHLDSSGPARQRPFWFSSSDNDGNCCSEEEEEEDEYLYADSEPDIEFYMFLFQELYNRDRASYANARFFHIHRHPPPETYAQYQARVHAAAERKENERNQRRADQEKERQSERKAAEQRQRTKAANKRAQAEVSRQNAAKAAQIQQQRIQALRTSVFDAARIGDGEKVKKGVWEDGVDPAGGEIKHVCNNTAKPCPQDPKETLLHIAATNGDAALVEWLDAHSADPEERNAEGFTVFHVALKLGHIPIVKYFIKAYDPKLEDSASIYDCPPSKSLLSIALESCEPEVIWIVLDQGLAIDKDIGAASTWVSSSNGKETMLKKLGSNNSEKEGEIKILLRNFGGLVRPMTPKADMGQAKQHATALVSSLSSNEPSVMVASSPSSPATTNHSSSNRSRGRRKQPAKSAESRSSPSHRQSNETTQEASKQEGGHKAQYDVNNRGQGRGRGHGRSRGHNRSRGDSVRQSV